MVVSTVWLSEVDVSEIEFKERIEAPPKTRGTAKVKFALAVPALLCALNVYVVVSSTSVGVPEICPVEELKVTPAGNGSVITSV